jgi:hypothetical protein
MWPKYNWESNDLPTIMSFNLSDAYELMDVTA